MREIFEKLNNRSLEALMFHSQMVDYFSYLGLPRYAKMHEKQFHEEAEERMKLKDFYLKCTDTMLCDCPFTGTPKYVPQEWAYSARTEMSPSHKSRAVMEAFHIYYSWEIETHAILQSAAKELFDNGHIRASMFVGKMLEDQAEEVARVKNHVITLKALDYHMGAIIDLQEEDK